MSTLRTMLDEAAAAITASRFARRGRVLRGMVHLRPADGYRRLIVLDVASPPGDPDASYLPSATAWRWLAKHECPVSIDVFLGKVELHKGGAVTVLEEQGRQSSGFDTQESAQRLLNRDASHLYVVPLRGLHGAIEGMISLEVECQSAIGQEFIFHSSGADLEVLSDIASLYLISLPLRPAPAAEPDELLPVIGATMAGVVQMARVFAQQDETILISGPTGAGKSRLSRWCHEHSPRRGRAFEGLDLATVPESLQLGELFGWRKGAFTGAVRDNPGCLARAEGGTLFIDEIDKLSLSSQSGLLQLLEERSYRTYGEGAAVRKANVRFIIGTNADLFESVQSGRFREDLYYRINVLPIKMPSLAERPDEIPRWARYMANRRHCAAVPGGEVRLSIGAEELLGQQKWPGNLRQLDNIIRRAYALALITYGSSAEVVALEEAHIERALSYEHAAGRRSFMEAMRVAGAAFVAEAERLSEQGAALDVDHADAFRGFVLGAAVQKLGSREAAFRVLGKSAQVASRNHHKSLRRELEKVEALCRALGQAQESPFAGLLEDEET